MQITITIDDENAVDSEDTPWTSNLTVTIDSGRVTEVAQDGVGADPIEALQNQLAGIGDDEDLVWLKRLYLSAVEQIQGPATTMTKQAAELTAGDVLTTPGGDRVRITGEVSASTTNPGYHSAEVDLGVLLVESEGSPILVLDTSTT